MYVIIWEYQVKPEHIAEFEKSYGENGQWVKFFRNHSSYLGTELLRSSSHHYLTIDRWESKKSYESFLSNSKEEYETLDARCMAFIEQETLLGKWETVSPESR